MDKRKFSVEKLAAYMSKPEVFADITAAGYDQNEKRRRIEKHRQAFLSGNPSGEFSAGNDSWVQAMGGAVEDIGNEEFSFMNDAEFNFEEYNKAAKAETAIFDIKRLARSLTHPVKDSIRQYVLQRNEVIKRNKAKKAEADKQKKDSFISRPSWY